MYFVTLTGGLAI